MQLKGEEAVEKSLRVVVGEIENESIVHEVADVIALRDDHDVVPVAELEKFLETVLVDQLLRDFLAVLAPDCLLTDQTDATALSRGTALVIDEACDGGKLVLVADLVLVAAYDPLVLALARGDALRSILNARVVCGVAAERQSQLEVLGLSALPDEERVTVGALLGRRFPADGAIFDRPELWVPVPPIEVLAVEDGFHALLFCRR